MYAGFLDLTQPLHWTAPDALSAEDCARYLARFRAADAEPAPVIGRSGEELNPRIRSNTRVMWDDEAEADGLVKRVQHLVPTRLLGKALAGGNPRIRMYRYGPGQKHAAHWDTVVTLPDARTSLLTLVFYLNDGFTGGETTFPDLGESVTPRRGAALLFQHRVLHEASEVTVGEKFVLRTDVLYR
jgi:hypothetical protein